jgi:hypothetical protein
MSRWPDASARTRTLQFPQASPTPHRTVAMHARIDTVRPATGRRVAQRPDAHGRPQVPAGHAGRATTRRAAAPGLCGSRRHRHAEPACPPTDPAPGETVSKHGRRTTFRCASQASGHTPHGLPKSQHIRYTIVEEGEEWSGRPPTKRPCLPTGARGTGGDGRAGNERRERRVVSGQRTIRTCTSRSPRRCGPAGSCSGRRSRARCPCPTGRSTRTADCGRTRS